jgi:hypothetical protein
MIPDHFTIQFGKNFKAAASQENSRFKKAAVVETGVTGEAKTHNLVLPGDDEDVTGQRFKKVTLSELETEKRWVRPSKFQKATGEDEFDEALLAPTILPGGTHIMNHAGAYARRLDKVLINGLLGVNYKGKDGTTQATIPAANQVAYDFVALGGTPAASCLTIEKIIKGVQTLKRNESYGDDARARGIGLWGCMTSEMEEKLLYLANAASGNRLFSKDFLPPVLNADGSISSFLGVNWIRSEQLLKNESDATIQYGAIWTSDALHLDIWGDIKTSVSPRPDLSDAIQFLSKYKFGACRSEDKKVVQIACKID